MIPSDNVQYLDKNFWEKRYTNNDNNHVTREWLGDYSLFCDYFRQNVSKSLSILILGMHSIVINNDHSNLIIIQVAVIVYYPNNYSKMVMKIFIISIYHQR